MTRLKSCILVFIIFFAFATDLFGAKKKTDSLLHLLKFSMPDIQKVNTLNLLSLEYRLINSQIAQQYAAQALQLSEQINYPTGIAQANENIAICNSLKGNYSDALIHFLLSIKFFEKSNNQAALSLVYNNLAEYVFINQTKITEANKYLLKSLKIADNLQKLEYKFAPIINLGKCAMLQKDYSKAIKHYSAALQIAKAVHNNNYIAIALANIGRIYDFKGDYENAISFLSKALNLSQELSNESLTMEALLYISEIYTNQKLFDIALEYIEQGIELSNKIGYRYKKIDFLLQQSIIYEHEKKFEQAFYCHKNYSLLKDSIFNDENQMRFMELQTRYESESRLKEIDVLTKDNETQNSNLKKNQIILAIISLLLLSIFVFSFFLYKAYRNKNEINTKLILQNDEIQQQKEEIQLYNENLKDLNLELMSVNEEIENQRFELSNQRDLLVTQNKDITDSIMYAEKIQTAVLTNAEKYICYFADSFIIFRPKDIISGDFYWVKKVNEYLLFALADCTGHGVPAAMLSMLGISFLNEIVARKEIVTSAGVLDELRNYITTSLQQTGRDGESRDGMDMAFCAYNLDTRELQFAGANICLYYTQNNVLQLMDGDKMPIGFYFTNRPFTNNVIKMKEGEKVYLTSDGYADQFGGPSGRKFYSRRFKELIESVLLQPMEKQGEIIKQTHIVWKGNHEQIDDILVMGLKF